MASSDHSSFDEYEARLFQEEPFFWLSDRFPDGRKRQEHMQSVLSDVPINANMANAVKDKIRKLVKEEFCDFYPEVIISYSTGCRKDKDVEGAGPGLMVAAAVIKLLFDNGHPCYSDIMTPEGRNWKEYMPRVKKAKVMLAMVTRTFLRSVHCLREMAEAVKHGVEIIPIRCEEYYIDGVDFAGYEKIMWPDKELQKYANRRNNPSSFLDDLKRQRYGVVDILTSVCSLPAHGTILSEPISTDQLTARVGNLIQQAASISSKTHSLKNGVNARVHKQEKSEDEENTINTKESSEPNQTKSLPSGTMGLVGVDFDDISVGKWHDFVIENQFIFEGKLQSLLDYGELCEGSPNMVFKRIRRCDGVEQVVLRLKCAVDLQKDLQSNKYERVCQICRQIAELLKNEGAEDSDLQRMMIGTAWKGSIMLLLEVPTRVVEKLFDMFMIEQRLLTLGEGCKIVGIAPAYLVNCKIDHPEKLTQKRGQDYWPDAVTWKNGGLILVIPSDSDSLQKLVSGGVKFWPQSRAEDWQSFTRTLTKDGTPEYVYESIVGAFLKRDPAVVSDDVPPDAAAHDTPHHVQSIPSSPKGKVLVAKLERQASTGRQFLCPQCGVKTHAEKSSEKVAMDSEQVHHGTCIRCNPDLVPAEVRAKWESKFGSQVKKPGSATEMPTPMSSRKRTPSYSKTPKPDPPS